MQKKSGILKRGRKKLEIDNSLLFDAFGDMESKKYSKLRFYVDQENDDHKMKIFTKKEEYPYKLGLQVKELDIIFNDISKGDEDGNNSRDLFNQDLDMFNLEYKPGFNPQNKEMVIKARTLPALQKEEEEWEFKNPSI